MSKHSPSLKPRSLPPAAGFSRANRRRPRSRRTAALAFIKLLLAAGLAASSLFLTLAAAGIFAYFYLFGHILPGVSVGADDLGGKTVYRAAVQLHKTWNLERKLTVTEGIHSWQVDPASLGLSVDAMQTARQAYAVGHGGPFLADLGEAWQSLWQGRMMTPVARFDPYAARVGLNGLVEQFSLPPKDAALRLEGETVVVVPGEVGYTINIEATAQNLESDPLSVLNAEFFQVVLQPVIPRINDVSAVQAEAERLLASGPAVRAFDPITGEWLEWTIPRNVIAAWLTIETGENGPEIRIDERQVALYVSDLTEILGSERMLDVGQYTPVIVDALQKGNPIEVLLQHRPTTYTIQPGDTLLKIGWKVGMPFWQLIRANPGLDAERLIPGETLIVPSKDILLPLPVIQNKRIVISIGRQRLWTYQDGNLLAEYIISTGIDRSPTQPGVFQIQTHELNAYASVWDLYMPHFLGIYEAWPGFMNGLHGLPTLSNGRRLWADILGRPASYGCIILDLNAAQAIYEWAENGVVVEIKE